MASPRSSRECEATTRWLVDVSESLVGTSSVTIGGQMLDRSYSADTRALHEPQRYRAAG
jgi:hypothetical protein